MSYFDEQKPKHDPTKMEYEDEREEPIKIPGFEKYFNYTYHEPVKFKHEFDPTKLDNSDYEEYIRKHR